MLAIAAKYEKEIHKSIWLWGAEGGVDRGESGALGHGKWGSGQRGRGRL